MAFKMRASRRDDGGYDFSYGKGAKRITAICLRQPTGEWYISDGFRGLPGDALNMSKKLKEVKEAWAAAVEVAYGKTTPDALATAIASARALPPLPSMDPNQLQISYPPRAVIENDAHYTPDPFDPRYSKPGGGFTTLGALDLTYHHLQRILRDYELSPATTLELEHTISAARTALLEATNDPYYKEHTDAEAPPPPSAVPAVPTVGGRVITPAPPLPVPGIPSLPDLGSSGSSDGDSGETAESGGEDAPVPTV